MLRATVAATALLLSALVTPAIAGEFHGAQPYSVPADPRAKYTFLEVEEASSGLYVAITKREGSSGVSYSARVIDCDQMLFKYLAEGDTLDELRANMDRNRSDISSEGLAWLVEGSSSDTAVRLACRLAR